MTKPNIALSNLRAVVIVIVQAFHASLAYLARLPPKRPHSISHLIRGRPFRSSTRTAGSALDLFCAWQDVSLMSLMFFLSGLLAAGSLVRKGAWTYAPAR